MTEHDDLGRRLAGWFEADALAPAPAGRFQQTIDGTRTRRPRPALLARLGSHWVETTLAADAPRVSWRSIAVVVLVALALAASAVFVGSRQRALPSVIAPAGGGLIAYSVGGDIYVGDWVTDRTKAIVTASAVDSSPKFSPDGSRIAFMRGDPWGADASVIVVRADGSDERVVVPAGFSKRGLDFTWTPNSASLLLNHDSEPFTTPYFDGELSLVDASGAPEPRLLTPPLPIGPGGPYFGYTNQVAPMFRPPDGDLILSSASGPESAALYLWDADLKARTQIELEGLEGYEPYHFQPWALWWSSDGSMIAFELGVGDREPFDMGTVVMQADGTDARGWKGVGGPLAWSPDGSTRIAYQRGCPDPDRQGAVVVVLDVASGAERVLEATAVETKYEGDVSPLPPGEAGGCYGGWAQGATGRAWDYEGWSWSPDGRYIVLLEQSGTRPDVVDVKSGKATELPWEADSAPSWQRITPPDPE